MEKNCKLFDYILLFLALLSLFYFIIVVTNSRFINAYILYPIFTAVRRKTISPVRLMAQLQ